MPIPIVIQVQSAGRLPFARERLQHLLAVEPEVLINPRLIQVDAREIASNKVADADIPS